LHLLLGPVNQLVNEIEKRWSGCGDWLKACNVKR
jgi:hypothetical protein